MTEIRNVAASVHARLLNLARKRSDDFNLLLQRYVAERFLCRLAASPYSDRFVLKGAMLYQLWGGDAYRATRDLDLLGLGAGIGASVEECVRQICIIDVPDDGVRFLGATVTSEEIREATEDRGVRVHVDTRVGQARVRLQIDVGLGDDIAGGPQRVQYPTLLGEPGPTVLAYPRETVVAEKVHAMVVRGEANSRLRDFHDLYVFAQRFEFEGQRVARAIAATFKSRRTELPEPPSIDALSPRFFADATRAAQWRAFLQRNRLDVSSHDFVQVGERLREFVSPVLDALSKDLEFKLLWRPKGPWQ